MKNVDHTEQPINVLSLCTGGAGLDLGIEIVCPAARAVVYVEHEAFAVANLVSRVEAMELVAAPIWSDVKTFDGRPWRGVVDIVIGGYPCQPFSHAGKRGGSSDPRHLWPDIARIVAEVQPPIVFFENVGGHLTLGFREVCEQLEQMDYTVAAGLFTASEVGAPHKRERLFILGMDNSASPRRTKAWVGPKLRNQWMRKCLPSDGRGELADTAGRGHGWLREPSGRERQPDWCCDIPTFPPGQSDFDQWRELLARYPMLAPAATEPDFRCVADGLADDRVRYLRMLGNGVVPLCSAWAFIWLWHVVRADASGT